MQGDGSFVFICKVTFGLLIRLHHNFMFTDKYTPGDTLVQIKKHLLTGSNPTFKPILSTKC